MKFRSKKIEKKLGNPKRFYTKFSKSLEEVFDMLKACETSADILRNPHPLHDDKDYQGCFALTVTGNYRLVFKIERKEGEEIIIIMEVIDYH